MYVPRTANGIQTVITVSFAGVHCSTANNKVDKVPNLFERALNDFGTTSRIRSDKGGENARVWEIMTKLRRENRGSYVAGSSVHINRLNVERDVVERCEE